MPCPTYDASPDRWLAYLGSQIGPTPCTSRPLKVLNQIDPKFRLFSVHPLITDSDFQTSRIVSYNCDGNRYFMVKKLPMRT